MSSPSSHPSSGNRPDPARPRRVPRAYAAALVSLVANLALRDDDRASVALAHLNLLLLFWCARRFDIAPPGSAARARARRAMWLLTASLTAAFTWRMCALLPPRPLAVIAAWVTAAATVGGGFYFLFVHQGTK